ncbi:hypothetical protein GCM10020000_77290 [Streptomyces olivoverticillatus]
MFLVRSDHWYDRAGIYRDAQYVEFDDAAARAAFFGASVAQWVAATDRRYDIVHGNDWQSGPALAHLRSLCADAPAPALLINVHSAEYLGPVEPGEPLGLPRPGPGPWPGTASRRACCSSVCWRPTPPPPAARRTPGNCPSTRPAPPSERRSPRCP